MKELSICQSPCYLALVSFPVLSQIKPHAPLLVCPPVNSFKFLPCDHTPPEAHQLLDFSQSPGRVYSVHTQCPKTPHASFRCAIMRQTNSIKLSIHSQQLFSIQSPVGIVYGWDYDGIWSSSIPQLSFLIYENIFVECFRSRLSFPGHWISPLSGKYLPPLLFLFFVCLTASVSPSNSPLSRSSPKGLFLSPRCHCLSVCVPTHSFLVCHTQHKPLVYHVLS